MPKYLGQASISTEGVTGTLKEGGSKRRAAVQQGIESLDGRLEAFSYAFGENDVVAIFDPQTMLLPPGFAVRSS